MRIFVVIKGLNWMKIKYQYKFKKKTKQDSFRHLAWNFNQLLYLPLAYMFYKATILVAVVCAKNVALNELIPESFRVLVFQEAFNKFYCS